MAHYVTEGLIQTVAADLGLTEEQVRQFVQTNVDNGNIQTILAYINVNQGSTETNISTDTGIDQTTTNNILTFLVFANVIEEF